MMKNMKELSEKKTERNDQIKKHQKISADCRARFREYDAHMQE